MEVTASEDHGREIESRELMTNEETRDDLGKRVLRLLRQEVELRELKPDLFRLPRMIWVRNSPFRNYL